MRSERGAEQKLNGLAKVSGQGCKELSISSGRAGTRKRKSSSAISQRYPDYRIPEAIAEKFEKRQRETRLRSSRSATDSIARSGVSALRTSAKTPEALVQHHIAALVPKGVDSPRSMLARSSRSDAFGTRGPVRFGTKAADRGAHPWKIELAASSKCSRATDSMSRLRSAATSTMSRTLKRVQPSDAGGDGARRAVLGQASRSSLEGGALRRGQDIGKAPAARRRRSARWNARGPQDARDGAETTASRARSGGRRRSPVRFARRSGLLSSSASMARHFATMPKTRA